MRIALVIKPCSTDTGIGKYVFELIHALANLGHEVIPVYPILPFPGWFSRLVRMWFGWDVEVFFQHYPVLARYPKADIYHLTSQNLGILLLIRKPPGLTVVTVHDVIPWMLRNDPDLRVYRHILDRIFDRMALCGVHRADRIITVSHFTTLSFIEATHLSHRRLTEVMQGIR